VYRSDLKLAEALARLAPQADGRPESARSSTSSTPHAQPGAMSAPGRARCRAQGLRIARRGRAFGDQMGRH